LTDDSGVATASIITLMIETAIISEKSVNFYKSTRRNIPKHRNIHTRSHENLALTTFGQTQTQTHLLGLCLERELHSPGVAASDETF
jgi:hypothetical protein